MNLSDTRGRSRDWWQGRIDMLADQAREASSNLSHAVFLELSCGPRLLPDALEEHRASAEAEKTFRCVTAELWLHCEAAAHHGFPGMGPSGPEDPQ